MEPLITIEGFKMMQDPQKSRDLLNNYYRQQGYEVVTPKTHNVDDQSSSSSQSSHTVKK